MDALEKKHENAHPKPQKMADEVAEEAEAKQSKVQEKAVQLRPALIRLVPWSRRLPPD